MGAQIRTSRVRRTPPIPWLAAMRARPSRSGVAFTDRGGYAESLTSDATETVSFAGQQQIANNPATGGPIIGGTARVGETLATDVLGIADEDGLENATSATSGFLTMGRRTPISRGKRAPPTP